MHVARALDTEASAAAHGKLPLQRPSNQDVFDGTIGMMALLREIRAVRVGSSDPLV